MAARPQSTIERKFDLDVVNEMLEWIAATLRTGPDESQQIASSFGPVSSEKDFQELLKDGVVLCHLINILEPGSVTKIDTSDMAFKQMENIGRFLDACKSYGVKETFLCQVVELYEATDIQEVVKCIYDLRGKAGSKGHLEVGPKEGSEN